MKRATVILTASLIIFCGLWFQPKVSGQRPVQTIPTRIQNLEEMVSMLTMAIEDLSARLEVLEGTGGISNSYYTLHLNPLPAFPPDPIEGDVCVVWTEYEDGQSANNVLYCFLNNEWISVVGYYDPIIRNPIIR
ncbi:hypothetical protein ACFL6U_11300 [Planctomycetota bacterium]